VRAGQAGLPRLATGPAMFVSMLVVVADLWYPLHPLGRHTCNPLLHPLHSPGRAHHDSTPCPQGLLDLPASLDRWGPVVSYCCS
jgi:hypothetical protein